MKECDRPLNIFFSGALRLWTAVTLLFSISSFGLYACFGKKSLSLLIQEGPSSITELTLVCVAMSWLSSGVALVLLKNPRLRSEHAAGIVCSVFILLLYLNFLREWRHFGDVADYVRAAFDLQGGRPFHPRYIYPPLLVTLCQPLLPLGEMGLAGAFWFANVLSLIAFFWILRAVLVKYGFGRRLSLCLVVVFMVVNVPILRTLGYTQINLHVMNLIMLAMLLFPRHRLFSALALATAVHLKASPLILALPFFLTKDKKWIMSFLAGLIGLASLTFVFYGWAPFASFFYNVGNIYSANGVCFRENSVDSLVRGTAELCGVDSSLSTIIILIKSPILALIFLTAVYNMLHSTYFAPTETRKNMLNSTPSLLILMVLASPLLWEHHPVFLAISYLLIIKKLNTPYVWVWYSFAYLLEFVFPTFDFFPWSYGRLISPIILTILMLETSKQRDSDMFLSVRDQLDSLQWRFDWRTDVTANADKPHN